jgi:hypothetical protein
MKAVRLIRLRYPATCRSCDTSLQAREFAHWDSTDKRAICPGCFESMQPTVEPPEIERGTAGASARREFERRRGSREKRIRSQHKHLGGLVLALTAEPSSTTNWAKGAAGEETSGHVLDGFRDEGFAVLHDRAIPASRANIDHLVISPAGIFIVDPKNYSGRVEQRDIGGWFKTDLRLVVGGRDRTALVKGAEKQLTLVRATLAPTQWANVPITPLLWFLGAENWPLLGARVLAFGDVRVLWGKPLGKLIRNQSQQGIDQIELLERELALRLPPA